MLLLLLGLQWAGALLLLLALGLFLPLAEMGPAVLCLWLAALVWAAVWVIQSQARANLATEAEQFYRPTPPSA